MRRALMLALLLVSVGVVSHAYDTTPLQISVWPPNLQVVTSEIDVSGLKLNLPYGGNNRIMGIDLGIASTSENCSAFQVNLLNMVGGAGGTASNAADNIGDKIGSLLGNLIGGGK